MKFGGNSVLCGIKSQDFEKKLHKSSLCKHINNIYPRQFMKLQNKGGGITVIGPKTNVRLYSCSFFV